MISYGFDDGFGRILQIVDPFLASYGVENPIFAVIQLAQTTMRSELGKITLDKTFEERDTLNENIVVWFLSCGILCRFYSRSFVCQWLPGGNYSAF